MYSQLNGKIADGMGSFQFFGLDLTKVAFTIHSTTKQSVHCTLYNELDISNNFTNVRFDLQVMPTSQHLWLGNNLPGRFLCSGYILVFFSIFFFFFSHFVSFLLLTLILFSCCAILYSFCCSVYMFSCSHI